RAISSARMRFLVIGCVHCCIRQGPNLISRFSTSTQEQNLVIRFGSKQPPERKSAPMTARGRPNPEEFPLGHRERRMPSGAWSRSACGHKGAAHKMRVKLGIKTNHGDLVASNGRNRRRIERELAARTARP